MRTFAISATLPPSRNSFARSGRICGMNPGRALARRLLPLPARNAAWGARIRIASLTSHLSAGIIGIHISGERLRFLGSGYDYDEWLRRIRGTEWEVSVIERFGAAVRPGDTVLDVGAWIGVYALLASRIVGSTGRVYAFEPDPTARRSLNRNIRLNRVKNVVVVPFAVGDSDDGLFLPEGELGTSRTQFALTGQARVPSTTLDAFCARGQFDPGVIKIDIEGGETRALSPEAAGTAIRRARIVFVEVHTPMGASRESLDRIFAEADKQAVELCRLPTGISNVAFLSSGAD